ncbi:MAG: hypothetical protein WCA35_21935, partial [Kovacikia sp.]
MKTPLAPVPLPVAHQRFWSLAFNFWRSSRKQQLGGRDPAVAVATPIGIGLVAIALGLAPPAHAASREGAITFNLPSDTPSASDSFDSPSSESPAVRESDPAPAAAPAATPAPAAVAPTVESTPSPNSAA